MTKTTLAEQKAEVKKDILSLRSALEWLDAQGDVLKTDVEVDPDLEITGLQNYLGGTESRSEERHPVSEVCSRVAGRPGRRLKDRRRGGPRSRDHRPAKLPWRNRKQK